MPKRTSPHDPRWRSGRDERPGLDEPVGRDDPTRDVEWDLVPGNPPVPINTWRTPSDHPGMSPALAERMLKELTDPGQPVHDATGDPVVTRMVAVMGRRIASAGSRTEEPEPAALVICGWPSDRRGLDPAFVFGALRRRLADTGTLVVFGDHREFDLGAAVRAATAARLTYLQHVLAVYAPTDDDRIDTADLPTVRAEPGGARHQSVHTDVLLFRQPQHG